jgi:hypothetical protein
MPSWVWVYVESNPDPLAPESCVLPCEPLHILNTVLVKYVAFIQQIHKRIMSQILS